MIFSELPLTSINTIQFPNIKIFPSAFPRFSLLVRLSPVHSQKHNGLSLSVNVVLPAANWFNFLHHR